jgi:hypothetical protein
MQNQTDMNVVESFLMRYGIDIGFLVSGFFGALLLVSKNSAQKLSTTIASILAGTACANYLTPVVMSILPESVRNGGKYAVAFVMGFMGLKGLELIIEKYMAKQEANVASKNAPKKKTRSKTNKPKVM